MGGFWKFIGSKSNRARLGWLGSGALVVIAGLWTAFIYFFPPKGDSGGKGTEISATIHANGGNVSIQGNADNSTINIGVPPETLRDIVREGAKNLEEQTAALKVTISVLEEKLDLNERQVRAALDILGEKDVPPERLAAKLVEIAERYKSLQAFALIQTGDDANTTALKMEALRAINDGQLDQADALLAQIETEQMRAPDRVASGAAETSARRGEIALTRLRYGEAATHFADAFAVLPPSGDHKDKRVGYLERESSALYHQGDEFGDNAALVSAIEREERLLELNPRERVPLDWARTQMNLGNILAVLAKRQKSSARMEEALTCMRNATEASQQAGESYWLPAAQSRITEMEAELIELKR